MRFSSVRRIARPASTFPTVRDISIVGGGEGLGARGWPDWSCRREGGELLSGCLVFFCETSAACGLWVNRRITFHHSEPGLSLFFQRRRDLHRGKGLHPSGLLL